MARDINVEKLDALVEAGLLTSYVFEVTRNDMPHDNPHYYDQLILIFPDKTRIVVIPEDRKIGGVGHDSFNSYPGLGIYTS